MILFVRGILDGEVTSAGQAAQDFLRSQSPGAVVHAARLHAKEPERIVFAVVYDEPGVPSRPSPYRLISVDRSSGDIAFLETTPESPYWIQIGCFTVSCHAVGCPDKLQQKARSVMLYIGDRRLEIIGTR